MKVAKLSGHISIQPYRCLRMISNYTNSYIGVIQLLTCDPSVFVVRCCGFFCCMPSFFFMHVYKQSKNDLNLYTVFNDEGSIVLISLYVDLIMTGSADNIIEEIKQQLSQKFEMKDLGEMHYCLGLEVWRDSSQTFLSQGKYAKSLLTKFKMDECKAAFVPLQQNKKLQVDDGSKYADATLYRQLVGSLIYLTTTRLDLAYAINFLSQFMTQPHENNWLAVKGLLRYLQGVENSSKKC